MGIVTAAGWLVVTRSGAVLSFCRTRKAAGRRLKRARADGLDAAIVEAWYSTGLLEDE